MGEGSAPRPGRGKFSDLRLRVVSSLVLALLALAAIWAGGIWTAALATLAVVAMALEWRSITAQGGRAPGSVAVPFAALAGTAPAFAWFAGAGWAVGWLVVAGVVAACIDASRGRRALIAWTALGTGYLGLAGIAFVALRGVEPFGFLSIIWAAVVVVAADVGGYFAGRLIGGPKLWPQVSPKKTWAGLGGGVLLAVLAGWIFSGVTTGTYFYEVCTVSAVAALLAQAGDLAESALKRHFGVKDAGTLIPGHGGVLDRLDGHMAAVLVAAAVTFWRGQAVFVW